MAANMAYKAAKIDCMNSDVQGLSKDDLYALHVLKHDVIAGIFRLYRSVGPSKSDPVLKTFFARLVSDVQDEIEEDSPAPGGGVVA